MTASATAPGHPGRLKRIVIDLMIALAVIWAIGPILLVLMVSVKPTQDIISTPPIWIFHPTFVHYHNVVGLKSFPFRMYLTNSIEVSIFGTILTLAISFTTAYSLARYRTGGKNLDFWILSARMVPPAVLIIPIYVLFNRIHLYDTVWCLILIYLTFNVPLAVWVLRSFIRDVPFELEESATVDGASVWRILLRIVLPLVAPGIAAVAVLTFMASWNEFFFALILTAVHGVTLTVGTATFVQAYQVLWGEIAAASTIGMLPPLILSFFAQGYLVRGLSLGAVKG